MTITVQSRAHRILKAMPRYTDLTGNPAAPLPEGFDLEVDDRPIGIYRNSLDSIADAILITARGLYHRREDRCQILRYDDIEKVQTPQSKHDVTGLSILCKNGNIVWLPLLGNVADKYYDAFEFLRFLNRVMEDRSKSAPLHRAVSLNEAGQVMGPGIHDAVITHFHVAAGDFLVIGLQGADHEQRYLCLRGVEKFGFRSVIDHTIVLDIYAGKLANLSAHLTHPIHEAWPVLMGDVYDKSRVAQHIAHHHDKYGECLMVYVSSSYGGDVAAICRELIWLDQIDISF